MDGNAAEFLMKLMARKKAMSRNSSWCFDFFFLFFFSSPEFVYEFDGNVEHDAMTA